MLIKTSVIFVALLSGLIFVLMPKLNEKLPGYNYIFYLALILVFGLVFLGIIIGFHKRKYAIRQKDITFKHGVLIHSMTTIPFSRIQHIGKKKITREPPTFLNILQNLGTSGPEHLGYISKIMQLCNNFFFPKTLYFGYP